GPPLSISPDGSRLVVRRHDGSVLLLDGDSGTILARTGIAWAYSLSPDGESLAIGTGDFVELWDSSSGERVMSLRSELPVFITFSPDGTRLAAPGADSDEQWASDWNTQLWQLKPQPGTTTRIASRIDLRAGVAVSADESRLVTVDDLVARVWDTGSGVELATLQGHLGPITSISTPRSPGAPYLATAGVEGSIVLWDLDSGQRRATLSGHSEAVRLVEFTHDGTVLGSAGDDHTVRLWDPATATSIGAPLQHPGPVTTLKFSRDKTRVLTASGSIAYLWELGSGTMIAELAGHQQAVWSVAITRDGTRIATHDGERIRLWDAGTGEQIGEFTDPGQVPTVEFSPDGERFSSAGAIWATKSGRIITELEAHEDIDHSRGQSTWDPVTFSADGALVATSGRLWNAHTGVLIDNFTTGHEQQVAATSLLRGGARLLTVSRDAAVIRDARTPLAAACERLRPFTAAYADVAASCERVLPLDDR